MKNMDKLNRLAKDYFGRLLPGGCVTVEKSTTKQTDAGMYVCLYVYVCMHVVVVRSIHHTAGDIVHVF
jgi:hypothetical protein